MAMAATCARPQPRPRAARASSAAHDHDDGGQTTPSQVSGTIACADAATKLTASTVRMRGAGRERGAPRA